MLRVSTIFLPISSVRQGRTSSGNIPWILQLHAANDGRNIIVDQSCIAGIHRQGPDTFAINGNILIQQVIQCIALLNDHIAQFLPIFDSGFPALRILQSTKAFPFLLALAGCFIVIEIYNIVAVASLDDRCHFRLPLSWFSLSSSR